MLLVSSTWQIAMHHDIISQAIYILILFHMTYGIFFFSSRFRVPYPRYRLCSLPTVMTMCIFARNNSITLVHNDRGNLYYVLENTINISIKFIGSCFVCSPDYRIDLVASDDQRKQMIQEKYQHEQRHTYINKKGDVSVIVEKINKCNM